MGLAELVCADAVAAAATLGIRTIEMRGVSWLVATSEDTVLHRWSGSQSVTQARVWEGIAQCLLTRLGIEWTESQGRDLGHWLREAASSPR